MADCTSGTVACWITEQADILRNIASTLEPVEKMITGIAYVIGIAFAFKAIYSLKAYGEARSMMSSNTANMKEPLTYLFVAGIFIYLPAAMNLLMTTTFGNDVILQYAPLNSSNSTINALFGSSSTVGKPLTMIIQVIGLIAFIRGWLLIARASGQGGQPGSTGKGLMHVFGGILAVNIVKTLEIVNNTLYG